MSNALLGSKIVVEEEQPKIRAIPTLATAVAGVLGVTEKGPVGVATLCQSFNDYVNVFGGHIAVSNMCEAVEGFFLNGGTDLWVVRTVHYTTISTPSTKTSAAATLNLQNATPADTLRIDGKYDGIYANSLKVKVSAATSGAASEFNLEVLDSAGVTLELYPNVTMDDTLSNYVETVVNAASTRITVTDLDVVTTALLQRPVNATSALLTGGSDGLGSIADVDYTGDSAGGTGLYAFDLVDDLTLLFVPGVATSAVHNAMITYCEQTRNRQVFPILDPPANTTASGMVTYVSTTASILNLSEFGAIYWPRIKVMNPSQTVFGSASQITIPPSGHVCGVYARNDNARVGGIYDPPAGIENGKLLGVVGLETNEVTKESVRDLIFPKRINPITTGRGLPKFIDGARTLKGNGTFPTVAQRRGVSFIERSVQDGLQFARHKNNDAALRATLYATVYAFLKAQMEVDAFSSKNPDTAYFVDFGDALNPPSQPNVVTGRIGLATKQPAEFIVLRFSQDTRAIDAELANT
jgi:phage tail sheath protein FI